MNNLTKISLIAIPLIVMITLVVGITKGMSDLNEQTKTRHESIPAAIQHLMK